MKFISCNKKLLSLALVGACCLCLVTTPDNLAKTKQNKQSFVFSEADLVKDAVSKIKKQLKQRDGKPYFVSRTYELTNNNKPLAVSTKTYFRNYRKKPYYENEIINTSNAQPSRIIEVTYNKAQTKDYVSITEKSKRNHIKTSKKINISNLL